MLFASSVFLELYSTTPNLMYAKSFNGSLLIAFSRDFLALELSLN